MATGIWNSRFGEHLQTARHQAMLSRSQLAARVGVSEESIRRWELGGARPSAPLLERLIVVLALDGGAVQRLPATPQELPPLAQRLRRERLSRGFTQLRAAALIGVAQPTYAGWEIGRATPSPQFARAVADFLGSPLEVVKEMIAVPFLVRNAGWPPLGQLIGGRRQELRMTRDELARMVGVAAGTILAWELGYRSPRSHQVRDLARAIGLEPEAISAAIARKQPLSALGDLVRARQQSLGLRLRDVAICVGVDASTLSRWMHGHHAPTRANVLRLAGALQLSPATVLAIAFPSTPPSRAHVAHDGDLRVAQGLAI